MSDYGQLDKAIAADKGAKLACAKQCEAAFQLSREWLTKYSSEYGADVCRALVGGSFSAAVEVVSAAYLGLMRSALFSLRTHFELAYAWLYYRDHPREWEAVRSCAEQARLPGAIDQYLVKYYPEHQSRWTALKKKTARKFVDPYARMSAFIHAGYPTTGPTATKPAQIVSTPEVIAQLPGFIEDVAETLSDVFVSCHLGNWHSLPDQVSANLEKRFGAEAKSKLSFD